MLNKIEALAKQAVKNQEKAEQLRAEVEQLKVQAAKCEADAEAAAESGDVESYKALKQKSDDVNAVLHVKQAAFKKYSGPCTREDALAAWSDFQREYDTAFNKALKEYDTEMKKQCARFMNIIKMQNRARDQRKVLATLAGMTDAVALDVFKFAYVDSLSKGKDRVFYLDKGEITIEESSKIIGSFMCQTMM